MDQDPVVPDLPVVAASEEEIAHGKFMYHKYCSVCHGLGSFGGVVPDLRYLVPVNASSLKTSF